MHLGLGPVVHVRHEGLVLVGPDLGADVAVLVGGLGVVESHVVGVQELHHLGSETSTALCLLHGHSAHGSHNSSRNTSAFLQPPDGLPSI